MKSRFLAVVAAVALTACGDGNAPDPIQLTEAQAEDMLDALSAAGAFETELSVASAARTANATALALVAAAITNTVDASAPCPDGGTAGIKGTATANDDFSVISANVTQTFSNCKSTSSAGTLWTFNGAPSIVSTMSMTTNQSTGAFTLAMTQRGALDVVGPDASGRCVIDLTLDASGNDIAGTGTITISGTVCGVTITQTVTTT